MIARW